LRTVFIHISKTAGSSFRESLRTTSIAGSYSDGSVRSFARSVLSDDEWNHYVNGNSSEVKLVRVHFCHMDTTSPIIKDLNNIQKYKNDFRFFTLIRDPIKRIPSEFMFIKHGEKSHNLEYKEDYTGNTEWSKPKSWLVNRELYHRKDENYILQWQEIFDMEIEDFISHPNVYNTQVKWLLGKKHLDDYQVTEDDYNKLIDTIEELDFKIGITEQYKKSIRYWNALYNDTLDVDNIPRKRVGRFKIELTEDNISLIQENNKYDIKLYNYALDKFNKLDI